MVQGPMSFFWGMSKSVWAMDQLHFKSAVEIARLIREREVRATEALEHFLARVEKYNPNLNTVIWLDVGRARERAKAADAALAKGEVWGPLHGLPMTIKESYNVAGSPTTWGDPKLANNVTETSALAAERLENAGAVLFGKTNVPLMLAVGRATMRSTVRPTIPGT
jgi:amidase